MSAQRRLRRPQRDAPGDAGRRQPAAARRRRSVDLGAAADSGVRCSRRRRSSPTSRRPRRAAAATTTRCRRASGSATSKGLEYLASYTLSRTRTNNLGYYGSGGVQAEGAYWMNTYEPECELRAGVLRRPAQLRALGELRAAVRTGRKWAATLRRDRRHPRRLEAERHLPGAHRASRSPSPTAAAVRCRARAATSGRTASATRRRPTRTSITGSTSTRSRARRCGTWGNCGIGVARAPGYQEHRRRAGQARSTSAARATSSSGRGVQPDQHAELQSAGARHQRAEHVRHDHEHGQHRADRGAGVEVLLLMVGTEIARRPLAGLKACAT